MEKSLAHSLPKPSYIPKEEDIFNKSYAGVRCSKCDSSCVSLSSTLAEPLVIKCNTCGYEYRY